MRKIRLIPVSMVAPTAEFVYAPSRLQQPKEITYGEFLCRYADHPHVMLVSFAEDGCSNPQQVTAYGYGLDAWWIVDPKSA